jgi:thiamine kinase-like enzyme
MVHGITLLMACMLVRQAAAAWQLNLDFPVQIMHAPLVIQVCCPTSHTTVVQGTSELEALQQGQVDSSTMQFIDFEYGSYNYRGYDFANNWCEYAGFEGDYSRYPDEKQQALFVTNYLQQQGYPSPVRLSLCQNATRLTSAKADT